jgi:hypothetical protein
MTDAPSTPPLGDKPAASSFTSEFLTLLGANWQKAETLDAFSKALLQRLQQDRQAELELGTALLNCAKPTDAFALYSQWASKRAAAMMEDGPKFARLWANLYGFGTPDPASKGKA